MREQFINEEKYAQMRNLKLQSQRSSSHKSEEYVNRSLEYAQTESHLHSHSRYEHMHTSPGHLGGNVHGIGGRMEPMHPHRPYFNQYRNGNNQYTQPPMNQQFCYQQIGSGSNAMNPIPQMMHRNKHAHNLDNSPHSQPLKEHSDPSKPNIPQKRVNSYLNKISTWNVEEKKVNSE